MLFGFVMMPSTAIACGTKTEKSCCKKAMTSQKVKKDCCKKTASSKEKSHEGCDGACKSITCSSSTVYVAMTVMHYSESSNELFSFSTAKQNYYYSEIFISSDFRSIWLPPKIG